jgi:putative colanic acid biosysnthesis UDP-glucose lipid carrier transferase
MISNNKSTYYLRLFLDLAIINISFFVSAIISQSLQILINRNYMFALMAALNFIWYFVSNVIEFYDDFNTRNFSYQFLKIIRNVIVQIFAAILFLFLVKENLFLRNFITLYTLFLIVLVSLRIQVVKFWVSKIRGKKKNVRNLLIIGVGNLAKDFNDLISGRYDFGFNLIGFLDDASDPDSRLNILGGIDKLDSIISERNIEEVVIALSIYAAHQLDDIIKICNKHAVRVHIIPDYLRFVSKKFQINMIANFPIITVRSEPLAEAHWRFVKRTFDIVFSFFAIILILSWLYPLLFILNRLFSPGPVSFRQDRVGAKDEIFKCYKFRTMYAGSEKSNKYKPTVEGDPRITKIGKFLRKSNIDELPQFINVFKGEMSIVGPRPHPIAFNEIYKEMVEEIKLRSWVNPGITGWAQIHGFRGDVPEYEENKKRTIKRIEYDLWYIENWSIWLDIQIILTTIWQMIKGDTKGV